LPERTAKLLAEVLCQSGSIKPSHVLAEMLSDDEKAVYAFCLSYSIIKEDIDVLIEALKSI
jgi:cysteine desulfurase